MMSESIELDDALKLRIQQLAITQRRSIDWIMHEAVQQYVEREERRESFTREALASWAEYQETGHHLTASETEAWLKSWGSDAEAEMPDCHA